MNRTAEQQDQFIHFMRRLNGHKRLVLGNHDHFPMHVYNSAGIQKIVGSHRHAGLVYSHWPLHPTSIASDKIIANVHGHIHQNDSPPGKYVNVSVERINYTPILLEEVIEIARARCV
jgi:calcineurin-like phosphoesterase family protein